MMPITLQFPVEQVPWDRPIIESSGTIMTKALPNSLAVDFQKKVRTAFVLDKLDSEDKLLFPLNEPVSLYMEINTNDTFCLPFAVKNILDAFNNTVYFDDVQIISLYARKITCMDNVIKIAVFADRYIDSQTVNFSKTITELTVQTRPCDLILPNKLHYNHVIHESHLNAQAIGDIKTMTAAQLGNSNIITGSCSVNMEISTYKKEADIDNLMINYVIGMQGMVYNRIEDISQIQVKLFRDGPENCIVTVS